MIARVVYDTMVFLQAASQPGRVHATMRAVNDGVVTLCLSLALLGEIEDVLTRPVYAVRFPGMTTARVDGFLADVRARAQMFDPVPRTFTLPGHPDDDHLFDLAIHAGARYLVTWESRLLALAADTTPAAGGLRTIAPDLAIVTPADLAIRLRRPAVE